jgi:hypothetical protein
VKEIELMEIELEVERREAEELSKSKSNVEKLLNALNDDYPSVSNFEIPSSKLIELNAVETKLSELIKNKDSLANDLKRIKHQLRQMAIKFK